MKDILNAWILKYIVVFIMVSTALIGAYRYLYYTPYEYIVRDGSPVIKINKINGDVYKLTFNTGEWTLIKK